MNKPNRTLLIVILGLLSATGPFSVDMYLPGFPAIAADLHTTIETVSYSLSSFFIGICVGQIAVGPLLDRFGRKRPLLIGLTLYGLASVGCALSTSIESLIAFRFLQALGGCVCSVAPNAIVRDTFPADETARVLSWLVLILGASPILAPTAGSYVVAHFGWKAVFVVSTLFAVGLFGLVARWLPAQPANASYSLRPGAVIRGFVQVLRVPTFTVHMWITALASAGVFAYVAGSPIVFMKLYGVSEKQFGGIFALVAGGLIACSQLNARLLQWYSSEQLLRVSVWVQMLCGLALLGGTAFNALGLYGTIGLLVIFASSHGFIGPNGTALAMTSIREGVGSAAALLGAMRMGAGAVASALVGLFFDGTALPMAAVMALGAVLSLAVLLGGRGRVVAEPLTPAHKSA
ncbi:MAG: Bcr/CflA family efflux MFS transporter [Cytophagales bacterium]|nr:MAG: Bcr/CflA family efflux MFS transporter [Cytophagales bacterium]